MKTVLANGCFDLFHYGHLLHLEAARAMGDRLIVSVTHDAHVNKEGRPIISHNDRAGIVAGLQCVNQVIIVNGLMQALELVAPDVLVKGGDYSTLPPEYQEYCEAHNIVVAFTNTPKHSTTEIINAIRRGL